MLAELLWWELQARQLGNRKERRADCLRCYTEGSPRSVRQWILSHRARRLEAKCVK
jgi:hypothetical protein